MARDEDWDRQEPDPDEDRGREADRPRDIPKGGWRDVLVRVKDRVSEDNVSLIAAGLALYALLAIFPALAAAVSVYGLVASPDQVASQVEAMSGMLPDDAREIIGGQLETLAGQSGGALGFGLVAGLVVSLWSARQGMTAMMAATNIAYHEREERTFLRQLLISLTLTLGAVVAFVLVVLLAVVTPIVLGVLGLGGPLETLLAGLRWVVLWFLVVLGLTIVYRYAPDRDKPQWRWVSWGAAIAATLWLIGSLLFALYVQNFGTYGETYGALGGVVVMLMWFLLSGFVVVIGAEINAELERQTRRDTTAGRPRRMGRRGAHAADTLGRDSRQA
jgi:membrane protein